jgi:hypothetical protein
MKMGVVKNRKAFQATIHAICVATDEALQLVSFPASTRTVREFHTANARTFSPIDSSFHCHMQTYATQICIQNSTYLFPTLLIPYITYSLHVYTMKRATPETAKNMLMM